MTKKKAPKPKPTEKSRRERVEELRHQQKAAERRRTIAIIGAFTLVGAIIIGAAAWSPVMNWINDPARKPASDFGVSAKAAKCGEPQVEDATGSGEHLDGQDLTYDTVPPSYGPHWSVPASFERKFYVADDTPRTEELVHNLEHGYTLLWYNETIAEDSEKLGLVEDISKRFSAREWDGEANNKFIAAPWDSSNGEFPKGKSFALTRWTAETGVRVFCSELSATAVEKFMKDYPWSDAPEPFGM